MAKPEKQYQYVDVDTTVLEPSPQRVRNILTLEERVRAIQAYDCRPMYTKVAKMFNCSWEQIKNIIANRDAILEFFAATKNAERQANMDELRQRKIRFLGECMYEYIQRAQFHTKADITEELLRSKALEFRDLIQIDNFVPNKVWINHFKATYNFSLSNRQITLTRTPPGSMELKDIMTYCTKAKQKPETFQIQSEPPPLTKNLYRTNTRIAVNSANDAALQEVKVRCRKINFLEKALFEYWNRSKYHNKTRLNDNLLRKVSFELKEILKIDNFYPDHKWLNKFVTVTYPALEKQLPTNWRPPPLSLDLKDILSYCSRLENKKQTPSTVTLTPKEPPPKLWSVASASQPTPTPIVQIHTLNLQRDKTMPNQQKQPHQHNQNQTQTSVSLQPKIKEEVIDLVEEELQDVKPNLTEITNATTPTTAEQQRQQSGLERRRDPERGSEKSNENRNTRTSSSTTTNMDTNKSQDEAVALPPPLKIRKIETINKDAVAALAGQSTSTVPPRATNTTPKDQPALSSDHEEQLPKRVRNYSDALKLLRPLEEFAMLEENYRVIGLIGQLEDIFKQMQRTDS